MKGFKKNDARRLRYLKASKKTKKRREERLWVEARWDTDTEFWIKQTVKLQATL